MTPEAARALLAQIDREAIARGGFDEFVRRAWHVIEPVQRLLWSWHLDEMCTHAMACTPPWRDAPAEGELEGAWAAPLCTDLLVNVPPGSSKSRIFSILWQAWVWTWNPGFRWICATYGKDLTVELAAKCFELVTSEWYRERWPGVMPPGNQAVTHFQTAHGGWRYSTTIGGPIIGKHCNAIVVDDPVKPQDTDASAAETSARCAAAGEWLGAASASRAFDKARLVTVLVMQRLTELDPSARLLERPGCVHLMLPAEFEPERVSRTPFGGDRRTEPGELLAYTPNLNAASLAKFAAANGGKNSPVYAAQMQQRPSPPGGLMFKTEHFRHFELVTKPLKGGAPKPFWVISVDANFKKSDESSDVGIVLLGSELPKLRLYGAYSARVGWSGTIELLREIIRYYGRPNAILIEDKANGTALIEELVNRYRLPNVIGLDPIASKEARAQAIVPYYEAHSIEHCSQLADAPGPRLELTEFEHLLETFPRGRRRDVVDALSQGLMWLAARDQDAWRRAVETWDAQDRAMLGGLGEDDGPPPAAARAASLPRQLVSFDDLWRVSK